MMGATTLRLVFEVEGLIVQQTTSIYGPVPTYAVAARCRDGSGWEWATGADLHDPLSRVLALFLPTYREEVETTAAQRQRAIEDEGLPADPAADAKSAHQLARFRARVDRAAQRWTAIPWTEVDQLDLQGTAVIQQSVFVES